MLVELNWFLKYSFGLAIFPSALIFPVMLSYKIFLFLHYFYVCPSLPHSLCSQLHIEGPPEGDGSGSERRGLE